MELERLRIRVLKLHGLRHEGRAAHQDQINYKDQASPDQS